MKIVGAGPHLLRVNGDRVEAVRVILEDDGTLAAAYPGCKVAEIAAIMYVPRTPESEVISMKAALDTLKQIDLARADKATLVSAITAVVTAKPLAEPVTKTI